MENIEIVSKSLRHAAWGFAWNGMLAVICGILIFVYPELLGMLVGILLVAVGLVSIIAAIRIGRCSK
jgi:uncharacterized membrane protein HdeD (DUF308 family)